MPVARFWVDAGRFIRREVRREITKAAFLADCEIEVKEDRGPFDSVLYFTVTGDKALDVLRVASRWIEANQ